MVVFWVPSLCTKVAVYWLINHCATYVLFEAGILAGTVGFQDYKEYPMRETVGAMSAVS